MYNKLVIDGETELDDLHLVSHIAQIENEKLLASDSTNRTRPPPNITTEDILNKISLLDVNPDDLFDSISDEEQTDPACYEGIRKNEREGYKKVIHLSDLTNIEIINLPKRVPETQEIVKIGTVKSQIDSSAIVESLPNAIPFDLGSVVCLADRTMIGTISDVFGQVSSPHYVVNLVKWDDDCTIAPGMEIYCDVKHSTLVTCEDVKEDLSDSDNSSITSTKTRTNITINYDKMIH